MKKILLSLAVLLGFAVAANAETAVLNFNDAADIKGTKDSSSGNYAPVESFKVGDFSFVCGFDKEGVQNSQKPKLWKYKGTFGKITTEWQVRIFSSAQGWFTITAPEGATMSKIVAYGPSGNLSTSVSVSADSGEVVMDSNSTTKIGTATWTGSASAVKFTASTGKPQIAYMEVTYEKAATPGGDFTASFVPESGQTLKEISTLEVNWNVPCNGIANGNWDMNTLYKKNGEDWTTVENYGPDYNAETGKVSFSFMTVGVDPKPFSTPGEYKFVIPAGKFWLNNVKTADEIMSDWDNPGNSPEVTFLFTIEAGAPVVEPIDFASKIISAYPGEEISAAEYWEGGAVTVQYEMSGAVSLNTACTDAIVMTLDGAPFGNAIKVDSQFLQVMDGSDVAPLAEGSADEEIVSQIGMAFALPEGDATLANGLYEMTIPAGFFNLGGQPNKEYKTSWRVGEAPAQPVDITSLIIAMEPGTEFTPEERWDGSIDVLMQLGAKVEKNTASTAKAVMKRDGGVIGNELAISSDMVMVQTDEASPMADETAPTAISNVALVFLTEEGFTPAAGKYEMTIPEGFFIVNGTPNAAYTKTWTVKKVITGDYGTTPDNGETVTKKIDEFSIEFPNASTVTGVTTGVTVKNEAGTDFAPFGVLPSGNKLTYFYIAGLENGTYTVTIPANTLTVDGTAYAKEISWKFTIAVPEAEKPVINPAEGKVAPTDLDVITITYPAGTTIVVAEDPFVTLSAGMSMTMYTTQLGESANIVKFTRQNSEELAEGDVTFTIYGGAYTVNGTANEMMTFNYTISKAPAIVINKPAITPAEGEISIDEAAKFTLTLADDLKATAVDADVAVSFTRININTPDVHYYTPSLGENGEVILTAMAGDELGAGEYSLVIPEGTFSVGDVKNPEFTYTFTLKTNAIDAVYGDASAFDIYTATGIVVVRNGNADDVNALAPGLYIINGKKVLIRK